MHRKVLKRITGVFLSLLLLGVMVGTASSATYDLCAGASDLTMPPHGGQPAEVVPVWGFGEWNLSTSTCENISVPGPLVEVPVGDSILTINLYNMLPEPVSLQILGQQLDRTVTGGVPQGPVWTVGLSDTVQAGARTTQDRVRSFAHEAPAATPGPPDTPGLATFQWTGFRTGTYLMTSGTNPAKQVQMGLYAAVKKDDAARVAYPDDPDTTGFDESVPYDKELILVYSEVDPVIHTAIAENRYGASPTGPQPHVTSSLERDPKYFLINGMAYDPNQPDGGGLNPINSGDFIGPRQRVLVRFLNAGYDTHVPQLLNSYMKLVAQDGNPYRYDPRQQYGVSLPAGKIVDAVIEPAGVGSSPIYDAVLNQTNSGAPEIGGMLAYLEIVPNCLGNIAPVWPDGPDSVVDALDLAALAADFGRADCGTTACAGDIEPSFDAPGYPDNDVDGLDLFVLTQDLGATGCP